MWSLCDFFEDEVQLYNIHSFLAHQISQLLAQSQILFTSHSISSQSIPTAQN